MTSIIVYNIITTTSTIGYAQAWVDIIIPIHNWFAKQKQKLISMIMHLEKSYPHKYKCLCGVRGKRRDSSLQEEDSHTYTLKLWYCRIYILYKNKNCILFSL